MDSTEAKAFLRRYIQQVFSDGDLTALNRYLAGDDFMAHVTELVVRWRTAFPDLRIEVEGVIVEGDRVVAEETLTGTHTGVYESPWLGSIAPTGRRFTWSRISIRDLADDRFVDGYWKADELELLEQLGVDVRVVRGDA